MGWSLKRKTNGSLCRTATVQLCACGSGYKVQFPVVNGTPLVAEEYTLTEVGGVWTAADQVSFSMADATFMLGKNWLYVSNPFSLIDTTMDFTIELSIDEETGERSVTVEITGVMHFDGRDIASIGTSSTVQTFAGGSTFLLSEADIDTAIRVVVWDWPYEEELTIPWTYTIPDAPAKTYRAWRIHLYTKLGEGGISDEVFDLGTTRTVQGEMTRFVRWWFSQGFQQTITVNWDGSATLDSVMNWNQYDQEGEPTRTIVGFTVALLIET